MTYKQIILDYMAAELADLCTIVQDYPLDVVDGAIVTYTEATNTAYRMIDGQEYLTEYQPKFDVFAPDVATADAIAEQINTSMSALGFRRTFCMDSAPMDGIRRKELQFRGLIGPGNIVYQ